MAINKDPAFLFYSKDFITSTQTMDWEERGKLAYILAIMHQEGRLSEKTLGLLLGNNIPDAIRAKLKRDEQGLWYNSQLEDVIAARAKFINAARENGKKGGRPKEKIKVEKNNPKQNPIDNHNKEMELKLEIDNSKLENENFENVEENFQNEEVIFQELEKSISHQTVEPLLESLPKALSEALDKLFIGKKWRHKSPAQLKENIERCQKYEEAFVLELINKAFLNDWAGIFYDSTDIQYSNWLKSNGQGNDPNIINGINFS